MNWAAYATGASQEVRLQLGTRHILSVAAAGGRVYATDRTQLRAWDAVTLRSIGGIGPAGEGVASLAAGDGWLAGSGDGGELRVWLFEAERLEIGSCGADADAALGTAHSGDIYGSAGLRPAPMHLIGHTSTVRCLAAVSGGGRREALVSGDDGGEVRVWLSSDGGAHWRCVCAMTGPPVGVDALAVALSPPGLLVVGAGSADGEIWLWNLALPRPHVARGHTADAGCGVGGAGGSSRGEETQESCSNRAADDSDAAYVPEAAAAAATILRGHDGGVTALAFATGASASPAAAFAGDAADGCAMVLASASEDGDVRLWWRSLATEGCDSLPTANWSCSRVLRAVPVDNPRAHAACVGFCGPALVAGCMVGGFSALECRDLVVWDLCANRAQSTDLVLEEDLLTCLGQPQLSRSGEYYTEYGKQLHGSEESLWRLRQPPGQDVWAIVCRGGEVWAAVEKELVVWGRAKI